MGAPHIKWWHLKGKKQGSSQHKILEEEFGQQQGRTNDMWNKRSQDIRKYLKRHWENRKTLDLRVKNCGGGMKLFRVKLE